MDKEQITKILSKIKDTVGENNYKLALAITGHRTGKIKDIIMSSKDGELLLEYVEHLEQQCKKQKEVIDKAIEYINNLECLHIGIGENEYNLDKMYGSTKNYVRDLLEILKGSDK